MTIDVLVSGKRTAIDMAVFDALFENSAARNYADHWKAVESGEITLAKLIELARHGQIPWTLFFAPPSLVQSQIKAKTAKLLHGLTRDNFSINSRDRLDLRDVELIVTDLLRKQELLKKHDKSLTKNQITGILAKPGKSIEADAKKLMCALGLTHDARRAASNKKKAFAQLVERLETNQILVSQSVNNYMAQRLVGVRFSGMTIRDSKIPYIFLAGGDAGDYQEPDGRRIFTLTLMSVLIARKIFAPVTYDGSNTGSDSGREFDIVGEMLMPGDVLRDLGVGSLDEIKTAADDLKVTPSAVTVRAMRLKMLSSAAAADYLVDLRAEYDGRAKPKPRQPRPVNAVRKYNGREFSVRMLGVLDAGEIVPAEFCRSVCLNNIRPEQINDFRGAPK